MTTFLRVGRFVGLLLVGGVLSTRVWALGPTITVPPANQTVVLGNPASFSVTATGGPLTYQWYLNGNPVAGATAATYVDSAVQLGDGGVYFVAVTNGSGTTVSSGGNLLIQDGLGNPLNTIPTLTALPVIGIQPVNLSATYTQSPITPIPLNLAVAAMANLPLSYQWSFNGTAVPGATGTVYGALSPGNYTVTVSTTAGPVTSQTAVVTWLAPDGTVIDNTPYITVEPLSGTVIYGTTPFTMSVSAVSLLPITYQWYLGTTALAGATGTTFAATAPGSYTVVATTTAATDPSLAATVTVMTAGGVTVGNVPTITVQPAGGTVIYTGSPVSLGLSVTSVSLQTMSYQWYLNSLAINGAVSATYTATAPGAYTVVISTAGGSTTSQTASVSVTTPLGVAVNTTPAITAQPIGATLTYGTRSGTTSLSVSALALLPLTYQWSLNGTAITGATAAAYTAVLPGTYTVTVTTSAGSITSSPAIVSQGSRVINLSSRIIVSGSGSATAGFVLNSTSGAAKAMLIRAVGPGLTAFGVTGVLAHPVLTILDGTGKVVGTNSGWANSTAISSADATAGAFPLTTGSTDAAIVLTLNPASYTARVSSGDGTSGAALVEAYELTADSTQLINISTLATVGGAGSLIGGFVISGTPAQVLVRAIGPTLASFGVSGVLAQPILTVTNSSGTVVGANTGWSSGSTAVTTSVAAATAIAGGFALPAGSADSVVLLTLPPGAYSAQVTGLNGGSGSALVEVYLVPSS